MSAVPVTCFQRSATAFCTAMPPPSASFRWEKSSLAKSGLLSSALKSVLTPVIMVYLCSSSFTKPGMSRGLVISTFSPPTKVITRQFTVSERCDRAAAR